MDLLQLRMHKSFSNSQSWLILRKDLTGEKSQNFPILKMTKWVKDLLNNVI